MILTVDHHSYQNDTQHVCDKMPKHTCKRYGLCHVDIEGPKFHVLTIGRDENTAQIKRREVDLMSL